MEPQFPAICKSGARVPVPNGIGAAEGSYSGSNPVAS